MNRENLKLCVFSAEKNAIRIIILLLYRFPISVLKCYVHKYENVVGTLVILNN